MKQLLLSLAFLLICECALWGKIVTPSEAYDVASNVFMCNGTEKAEVRLKRISCKRFTNDVETPSAYYIFNRGECDGFVIIAGDTKVTPVLGYSDTGSIDVNNMPPELELWMEQLERGIGRIRADDSVDEKKYEERWASLREGASTGQPFTVLLYETAEWGQRYPFNSKCPIFDGQSTISGCTATGFAILLRYFEYPNYGHGRTESYSYDDDGGNTVYMDGESLSRTFDWSNMPLKYDESWSESSCDEVGTLVYLCALAAQTSFSTFASGGDPSSAHIILQNNLDYDKGSLFYSRAWFSDNEWTERIKTHLDTVGPLLYSAYSEKSGHVFIVDGYDSEYNFHINWGWTGSSNGYFAFPDWLSYDYYHSAAFDLQPDKGNPPVQYLTLTDSYGSTGISLLETEEVRENTPFSIVCGFLTTRSVSTPFEGKIVAATISRNGSVKEVISEEDDIYLDAGWGYRQYPFKCLVSKEIEVGDRITLLQKNNSDGVWRQVFYDHEDVIGELPIYDQLYIDESTSVEYDPDNRILIIGMKDGVSYSLYSDGTPYAEGISSSNEPVILDINALPVGEYILALSKRKENLMLKLNFKE